MTSPRVTWQRWQVTWQESNSEAPNRSAVPEVSPVGVELRPLTGRKGHIVVALSGRAVRADMPFLADLEEPRVHLFCGCERVTARDRDGQLVVWSVSELRRPITRASPVSRDIVHWATGDAWIMGGPNWSLRIWDAESGKCP